jgi:hypothetical protein
MLHKLNIVLVIYGRRMESSGGSMIPVKSAIAKKNERERKKREQLVKASESKMIILQKFMK